jgi:hypothetical protein
MLVLRFKGKTIPREWKVPFNVRIGKTEIPVGLGLIAMILFSIAGINLITKQVATISGAFFTVFWASERINERRRGLKPHVEMDQFKIIPKEDISESPYIRPKNVLCLVRDYNTLGHVRYALEKTNTEEQDLVVMTIRLLMGPGTGYEHLDQNELFTSYEQLLFSKVVSIAEKAGKHVELLVVPSSNVFQAIALTVAQLKSSEVIAGKSSVMSPEDQARQLGQAWERVPMKPDHPVTFRVVEPAGRVWSFYLGAHAPALTAQDIELIHHLWLELSAQPGCEQIHHRDVVLYALNHLDSELKGVSKARLLEEIRSHLGTDLTQRKLPHS